jgi:uncharacterized membrane protein
MMHDVALTIHMVIGSLGAVLYWLTLGSRKGARLHRTLGKAFLALMVLIALSVGPLLFSRPGEFDPGHVVQFVYLSVCVVTISGIAFAAIRFRNDVERFRTSSFRAMGYVLRILGMVVLVAGFVRSDPVAVVLSWVGLVYGSAIIVFAAHRGPLHPKWWLGWHLNAVSGLFNAVHGTLLFVIYRSAFDSSADVGIQVGFQVATTIAALAMRLWFGEKFGVPLRFGIAHRAEAAM